MPKTAFYAIENSISSFLGGAGVSLVEVKKGEDVPEAEDSREIMVRLTFDDAPFLFRAIRDELGVGTGVGPR